MLTLNLELHRDRLLVLLRKAAAEVMPVCKAQRVRAVLLLWWQRHHSRQQLRALCPSRYEDLGLTQKAVDAECRKAFWEE